jgi:DNA end-binding protein Ku
MARSIWSGAISFGLVNVPVKLYSAVSPKTVRFHQLHAEDGARIRQKRVCSADGEEVPYEQIVKGYEIGPDRYVVITPDELDALDPDATRTIDIEDFVDLVDIDPIYFDHPYYLAPGTGAGKSYRLLMDAMEKSGKVAIARVVIRTKQQLCAIRPSGGILTMATMNYGDEVVAPDSIDELDAAADAKASERELKMAQQLIDSLAGDWDPSKYRDDYRERVIELIERKAAGEEIAVQPAAEEPKAVPDLMAALEASLAAVKSGDSDAPAPATGKKKPAAKKKAPANGAGKGGTKPKGKAKAAKS